VPNLSTAHTAVMLSSDELIETSTRMSRVVYVTRTDKVLRGACAPLSRNGEPLAGWEASRQTGREPQHLGQSGFAQDNIYEVHF
jgi:hypothetical protein